MDKRFHINDIGTAEVCTFKNNKCPYGGDKDHYPSEWMAYNSITYHRFQQRMEKEYGYTLTPTKTRLKSRNGK